MNQLRDCTIAVYEMFISEIIWTKIKLPSDSIKGWFKNKHTHRFLELDRFSKVWHERENQIDWSQTKSAIMVLSILLELWMVLAVMRLPILIL